MGKEPLLGVPGFFAFRWLIPHVFSIMSKDRSLFVIADVDREDGLKDRVFEVLIFHREENLDPPVKVPGHEVRTPKEDLPRTTVPEIINTCMLEEPPYEARDRDVLA